MNNSKVVEVVNEASYSVNKRKFKHPLIELKMCFGNLFLVR